MSGQPARPPGAGNARRDAAAQDAADPLGYLREHFVLPDGVVYLDGNSLGAMPASVPPVVQDVLDRQWGTDLILSWQRGGWWEAPARVGGLVEPIIGAAPGSVVVTDSTSVNLFKAVIAAARIATAQAPDRRVIVVDDATFPTDRYIVDECARLLGMRVRPAAPDDVDALGPDVAVALFCHVDFRTGVLHDLPAITDAAKAAGTLLIWDVCHSAGAVPIEMAANGVDIVVGCTYKYLNGGPGSPAFVAVAPALLDRIDSPLPGWHSHAQPFAMSQQYEPIGGIERLRTGTPPLLSLLALEAALQPWRELSINAVRARSLELTGLMIRLVDERLAAHVDIVTPREHDRRGSQISLRHPQAFAVVQALIARGVIGDFRAPDIIRLGFAPLYVTRTDVVAAVQALQAVLESGEYTDPRFAERGTVT